MVELAQKVLDYKRELEAEICSQVRAAIFESSKKDKESSDAGVFRISGVDEIKLLLTQPTPGLGRGLWVDRLDAGERDERYGHIAISLIAEHIDKIESVLGVEVRSKFFRWECASLIGAHGTMGGCLFNYWGVGYAALDNKDSIAWQVVDRLDCFEQVRRLAIEGGFTWKKGEVVLIDL